MMVTAPPAPGSASRLRARLAAQARRRPRLSVLVGITCALFAWGYWQAMFYSPPDWRTSELVRLMYLHVPATWCAIAAFGLAAAAAFGDAFFFGGRQARQLRDALTLPCAGFSLIALVTGIFWAQPTWGTWWVWDPRLTLLAVILATGLVQAAIDALSLPAAARSWVALAGPLSLGAVMPLAGALRVRNGHETAASFAEITAPALHRVSLDIFFIMTAALACLFALLVVIQFERGESVQEKERK